MSHRPRRVLVLAAVALTAWAAPARAQQTQAEKETRAMLKMLAEPLETKEFVNPMALKDAIGLIYEKFAARKQDLPIVVDANGFREEAPDATNPYEVPVSLPPVPRQMTAGQALQLLLRQLPAPATYVIRSGPMLVIVPERQATIHVLLQRPVVALFDQVPLRDALTELAHQSGATINLDGRAADKLKQPVTATFRSLATLQDAVQVLTDQAGLKAAVLQNSVYVTTPENATQLERENSLRPRPPAPDPTAPPAARGVK